MPDKTQDSKATERTAAAAADIVTATAAAIVTAPAATAKTPAAIVRAPVVTDAATEEGVKNLLSWVDLLTSRSNIDVAAAENRRLRPYFTAMSAYLNAALDKTAPESTLGAEAQELRAIATPRNLSKLFNAMAAATNSTLISDVVVAPDDIGKGPAKRLFASREAFNKPYSHAGRVFNMGFMQVYEGGEKSGAASGTTFPVLLVDHKLLGALPKPEAASLLAHLKGVMTLVNHDMLHHFTSTYIGGNTVYKNHKTQHYSTTDAVREWSRTIPHTNSGEAYEAWAQMGQEKILLQRGGDGMVAQACKHVERYMDGLARVRDALLAPEATPERIQNAHETVDYFGTVLLHGLTRVFPLNHGVMQYAISRLGALDPAPEKALEETVKNFDFYGNENAVEPAEKLAVLRKKIARADGLTSKLVAAYRDLGYDAMPADDAQVGYKSLKMLQLINMGGLHDHVPKIADASLTKIRENMDDLTLRMIKAAAQTADFSAGKAKQAKAAAPVQAAA